LTEIINRQYRDAREAPQHRKWQEVKFVLGKDRFLGTLLRMRPPTIDLTWLDGGRILVDRDTTSGR